MMNISSKRRHKIIISIILSLSIISLIREEKSISTFKSSLRQGARGLSKNLGGGDCLWTPPIYDVPNNVTFTKTIITGFPGADKRMTFIQLEALTGLSARDEWDFEFLGMTNQPFIKSNYPHHEGIWGWEDVGDQVIMTVWNIRRSMVEYHDILWDIGYAKTFYDAFEKIPNLYSERPPLADFLVWRDLRVMDEIHWYGWFIDYWMEAGLMRDIFTHKITTPKHWYMLMQPTVYTRDELRYDLVVGDDTVVVEPSYDPHCVNDVSQGCHPIQIISVEKLIDTTNGHNEGRKIAETIVGKTGFSDYLIEEEAWQCIWKELIVNRKGLKVMVDRPNSEYEYNFSAEMLELMVTELDRLITKYSSSEWNTMQTAQDLVSLLTEHRVLVEEERLQVISGARKLGEMDILGEGTRMKLNGGRNLLKTSTYDFQALELKIHEKRMMRMGYFSKEKSEE